MVVVPLVCSRSEWSCIQCSRHTTARVQAPEGGSRVSDLTTAFRKLPSPPPPRGGTSPSSYSVTAFSIDVKAVPPCRLCPTAFFMRASIARDLAMVALAEDVLLAGASVAAALLLSLSAVGEEDAVEFSLEAANPEAAAVAGVTASFRRDERDRDISEFTVARRAKMRSRRGWNWGNVPSVSVRGSTSVALITLRARDDTAVPPVLFKA